MRAAEELVEAVMLMRGGCFFAVVVVVTMFRLRLLLHCWPDDLVEDMATISSRQTKVSEALQRHRQVEYLPSRSTRSCPPSYFLFPSHSVMINSPPDCLFMRRETLAHKTLASEPTPLTKTNDDALKTL